MRNNLTPKECLQEILLRMNYDSKKTLEENIAVLREQSVVGAPNYGMTNKDFSQPDEPKKPKYPQYCSYPNLAILPATNFYGLSGKDALVTDHCAYKSPVENCNLEKSFDNQSSWILLPSNSKEIRFIQNEKDYEFAVDYYLNQKEIRRTQTYQGPPTTVNFKNPLPQKPETFERLNPNATTAEKERNKMKYIMWARDNYPKEYWRFMDEPVGTKYKWNDPYPLVAPTPKLQLDRNRILEEFKKIFPIGSVWGFTIKGYDSTGGTITRSYKPSICNRAKFWNSGAEAGRYKLGFEGYYNESNQKFETAIKVDTRTRRQKILDKWEGLIYFVQFVVAVGATAYCNFCSGALWADLLTSAGVAVAYTHRNLEKGDEVGAALSAFFGVVPFLYFFKGLKGFTPAVTKELEEAFAKSGLKATSTPKEFQVVYESLSEPAKTALNQMLRNDQFYLNQFFKNSGKDFTRALNANYAAMFKADPSLIRRIPLKDRIWFRTIFAPMATAYIAAASVNQIWGSQLNTKDSDKLTLEEKEKLDGVWEKIPEELQQELAINLINNPAAIKKITSDPNWKKLEQDLEERQNTNVPKVLNALFAKDSVKAIFEKNGYEYEHFMNASSEENYKLSEKELQTLLNNGWILADDWDNESEIKGTLFINDKLLFKAKKK